MFIVLIIGIALVIFYQKKIDKDELSCEKCLSFDDCLEQALSAYSAEVVERRRLEVTDKIYAMPDSWLQQVKKCQVMDAKGIYLLEEIRNKYGYVPAREAYMWAVGEYMARNSDVHIQVAPAQ